MGIKEIITYVSFFIGFIMIIYVRVHYANRQKENPDNQYTLFENRLLKLSYGILILSFVLACIPIY